MAGHASGGEVRGNVIRHLPAQRLCAQPCRYVTARGIAVCHGEIVFVADVARCARCGHVRALQRPTRSAVVKLSVYPEHSVVAGGAECRRETRRNVIRHGAAQCRGALPCSGVAAIAIRVRGGKCIVVASMAIRTGDHLARRRHLVRSRQSPARCGVIEYRGGPRNRVMARGAVRRCERRSR